MFPWWVDLLLLVVGFVLGAIGYILVRYVRMMKQARRAERHVRFILNTSDFEQRMRDEVNRVLNERGPEISDETAELIARTNLYNYFVQKCLDYDEFRPQDLSTQEFLQIMKEKWDQIKLRNETEYYGEFDDTECELE